MTRQPTNVIDLSLKYAAAAGAIVYFIGLLEEFWVFANFNAADELPIADAKYFAIGAMVLFALGLSNIFIPQLFSIFKRPTPSARASAISSGVSTLFVVLAIALWVLKVWFRDAMVVAVPAAILAAALAYFLHRGQRPPELTLVQQIAVVVLILVPLVCWLALGAGQVHWRSTVQNQRRIRMQLLISPEAIKGAQQMGIVLPASAGASGSAELSEPVEIMFQGDRSYGLRLNNGRIVRLSKDKVWGMIAETGPYHYLRTVTP